MNLGMIRAGLSTLRHRDFRSLFLARTISVLGTNVVPVALAFAVLDLGSATDLGLVLGARSGALVLLLLVGGVWGDRLRRNAIMLTADGLRFLSQGAVGVLLLSGHAEVWHLALLQMVAGSADAFFMPASTGIVPQVVPPERLQQANALLSVARSGAVSVAPAIGGLLVATVGSGWAFVLDSASYAVSALFLYRLRLPKTAPAARRFLEDFKEGWGEFKSRSWVLAIDAWAAFANMFVLSSFLVLGPVVARQELDGASSWALILVAYGLGSLAGDAVALGTAPARPLVVGCAALTAWAAPLVLMAVGAPAATVAAGTFVAALSLALFNALFVTALQQHVPEHVLSRVTAYDWLASIGFAPVGLAIVAPLSSALGMTRLLVAVAAAHVACAAAVIALPGVRALRAVTPGEGGAPAEAVPAG